MGPSLMTDILITGKFGPKQITEGGQPCGNGDRYWNYAAKKQRS